MEIAPAVSKVTEPQELWRRCEARECDRLSVCRRTSSSIFAFMLRCRLCQRAYSRHARMMRASSSS